MILEKIKNKILGYKFKNQNMETNNNNSLILSVLFLLIGLGSGFYFGNNNAKTGTHVMPDGSIMTNETMDMAQMMADMNKALIGKVGDEFDKAFLSEMIVHHQGAVEMAKLALTNTKHQEIKDLAESIISAQNKEIGDMKNWLKDWYKIGN